MRQPIYDILIVIQRLFQGIHSNLTTNLQTKPGNCNLGFCSIFLRTILYKFAGFQNFRTTIFAKLREKKNSIPALVLLPGQCIRLDRSFNKDFHYIAMNPHRLPVPVPSGGV